MLMGYPEKQVKMTMKDGTILWAGDMKSKSILQDKSGTIGNESRMGYALPQWLVDNQDNENGTVLLLDDFSRAQSRFMQAAMEIN